MGNPKRTTGDILRVTLMASSILLLVLLQSFWLVNSYKQSFLGFQNEASALFRTTVYAMRDSIFRRNFGPLPPEGKDSLVHLTDSVRGARYIVTHKRGGGVRIKFRDI